MKEVLLLKIVFADFSNLSNFFGQKIQSKII